MIAIGFGLAWFGYSVASWGYFLVKGYDVKFTDWINPVHPYKGNPADAGTIPPYQVIPTGTVTAKKTAKTKGTTPGPTPPTAV